MVCRELEAYMVKNGNDCCRFELKNGGAGGCARTLRLRLKIPRF